MISIAAQWMIAHGTLGDNDLTSRDQQLIDELHRKIGRNLLRFQHIEAMLKHILPYIHPRANTDSVESWLKFEGTFATKTLGMLVQDLDHSVEVTPADVIQGLKKHVDARNELVHHFFQRTGIALASADSIHEGIVYLDTQFEESKVFLDLVGTLNLIVMRTLLHTHKDDSSDMMRLYELVEEIVQHHFDVTDIYE